MQPLLPVSILLLLIFNPGGRFPLVSSLQWSFTRRHSASRQGSSPANCVMCSSYLYDEVKQRQHLQRLKQRIMQAISHSNGNDNSSFLQGREYFGAVDSTVGGNGSVPGAIRRKTLTVEGISRNRTSDRKPVVGKKSNRKQGASFLGGPDIVSFSEVNSSRSERKHVLLFQLNSSSQQIAEDLDVVRVNLWLKLTSPNEFYKSFKKEVSEAKINSSNQAETSADQPMQDALTGDNTKAIVNKKRSRDKQIIFFTVSLLSDDGVETQLTDLRTRVKVTHWRKLTLPVGTIKRQLQFINSTLTLVVRFNCCEGSSDKGMALPKSENSPPREGQRLRRKTSKYVLGKPKPDKCNHVSSRQGRPKAATSKVKRQAGPLPKLRKHTGLQNSYCLHVLQFENLPGLTPFIVISTRVSRTS